MKLVLLIRSLEIGGAERQLVALARGAMAFGHEVHVLTFYPSGVLRGDLERAGVPVSSLNKRDRWDVAGFLLRLVMALRQEEPTVLYSFLPMANLVGLLAARLAGVPQVAWGVRASNVDLTQYDRLSRFEVWLASMLARYASTIICNSEAGAAFHSGLGYPADRMTVIPNGIDTDRFCFDEAGRNRVRKEWGVTPSDLVIGLAARLDPMKGHETALKALALLGVDMPNIKLVCVGVGPLNESLRELSRQVKIEGQVIWAGARSDMPAVFSAFDISSSSSSYGEGFSNAIAEAMACERLCVVTDVGDSASIVGETGWVAQASSPEAMAEAWCRALTMISTERKRMEIHARQRIVEQFSVERMVKRTLEVLQG
jgi:glycosyltransferase involved in cell wall biosynthesis